MFTNRKGFTLIEMTVVIGILAILATLAIPNIGNLTDTANDVVQQANLKNLHTSLVMHQIDEGNGLYPGSLDELEMNLDTADFDYYLADSSQSYAVSAPMANSDALIVMVDGYIYEDVEDINLHETEDLVDGLTLQ